MNEDHEMDFDNADSAYFMGGHATAEDYASAYDDYDPFDDYYDYE